jgi:LysM repeat protein
MTFYRIVWGDTLLEIAMRFNTTMYAIQALNPTLIKDVNKIQAGWEIRVL